MILKGVYMSKIDKFNSAKNTYKRVKENLFDAMARDKDDKHDSHNDKACLYLRYCEKHTDNWNDAILFLHASHGYYGSSSGYSDMNKEVAEYMVKALNSHIKEIAYEAIELAKKDMEQARKEAEDEAKEVLEGIKS
jgi:hypothetical protein